MTTLKEISQEHMSNMSEQFFKHFVENYNERTFTMDDLVNDEVIKGCIGNVSSKSTVTKKQVSEKKVKKKNTQSPPRVSNEVRQSQGFNKDKCKCRIWKNGLDNIQCSGKIKNDEGYCGRETHNDDWWLGNITEPRPEEPIGGTKNTRHHWHDQEKPKKSKKTPEKEDKPKRKVKKESIEVSTEIASEIVEKVMDEVIEGSQIPEGAGVGEIPPLTVDEYIITPRTTVDEYFVMMTECSKNEDNSDVESASSEDEDEKVEDFDYEGVIYKKLPADNMILNRRCGRQLGKLIEDGTVEFFGEEEKAIHIKNKE
jgi:hypothetical protein